MEREIISIYVDNVANVVSRVAGLFGRRGFNIDSFTSSKTIDPDITRITIVATGDKNTMNQIITQTAKLEIVKEIKILDSKESFFREMLMVKVKAGVKERRAIKDIADIYRAKIIRLSRDSMVLELIGNHDKLQSFLEMLKDYEITDLCRTGITEIEK